MDTTANDKLPYDHNGPPIINTTDATFESDVIERSKQTPVIVDFWASWCQPCRMLAPVLEKAASDYGGRFVLVKADTDQAPRAAGQFNVQSIPAVFAVVDAQVVDFFQGVLAESQLHQWLDRVLLHGELARAQRSEADDPAAAEQQYRDVLAQAPDQAEALAGLGRALLAQQREEEAMAVLQKLEARGFLEPEAEKLKAQLELRQFRDVDLQQLRAAVNANPSDLAQKLKLAEALAGQQQFEEALQTALEIVPADRKGVGEQARQLMVDIFRVLPSDSPLVSTYRRKLSTALY